MQVEDCLQSANPLTFLMDLYETGVQQLSELSQLVGESLSEVERRILIALITLDVHNRWASLLTASAVAVCSV